MSLPGSLDPSQLSCGQNLIPPDFLLSPPCVSSPGGDSLGLIWLRSPDPTGSRTEDQSPSEWLQRPPSVGGGGSGSGGVGLGASATHCSSQSCLIRQSPGGGPGPLVTAPALGAGVGSEMTLWTGLAMLGASS